MILAIFLTFGLIVFIGAASFFTSRFMFGPPINFEDAVEMTMVGLLIVGLAVALCAICYKIVTMLICHFA